MPVVFIHGVNTRDTDEGYQSALEARDELLRRLVLQPLAARGGRFAKIAIRNAYWGGHGVTFAWNMASLPEVSVLEHLGAESAETSLADIEVAATLQRMAGPASSGPGLEVLGSADGLLTRAARQDLTRFLETVLTPVLLGETWLGENANLDASQEGRAWALLAIAVHDVATSPAATTMVAAASSDEALMDELKTLVLKRLDELAAQEQDPSMPVLPEQELPLESLGVADWWRGVTDAAGELFDRAKDAPGRAATVSVLDLTRERTHQRFSRFLGDVFVYLHRRGDAGSPGEIVKAVLTEIENAPRHHPQEPLIVITHSLGGIIFYDIVTTYAPTLKVDAWISVGSQVAQFEEMKLFRASNEDVRAPDTVASLKPKVGYWLNVYDPADILSFRAMPVFAGVDADVPYLSGAGALKAHGQYFGRASFYELVFQHLATGIAT